MVHDIHLISCACAHTHGLQNQVAFTRHLLKQWFHEDAHASITLDYAEWIWPSLNYKKQYSRV